MNPCQHPSNNEINATPSTAYVDAARDAQRWILERQASEPQQRTLL